MSDSKFNIGRKEEKAIVQENECVKVGKTLGIEWQSERSEKDKRMTG